jgi:hypothetical protein
VKTRLLAALAAGLFGLFLACSQGETHPPLLGDCTGCSNPLIPTLGATTDAGTSDATVQDASDGSPAVDATVDAADADDGSALDGADAD